MPSYRKLPSGRWQAVVKHPSGKRYTKTDPLKKVVAEWATGLELEIRRGVFVDPNAGKITLEQWWVTWLETRSVEKATASKSETHWRVHVRPAFGSWPIGSIRPLDVRKWVAAKANSNTDGRGGEALATALRLLRQLLEAAVEAKVIRENPAESVKAPTPPKHVDRFLSLEEAHTLVACVLMPDRSVRVPRHVPYPRIPDPANRLFVKLMLDAGLRWQEAAGLHVFRVDLKRRVLRVQEVVERGRVVKLQPKSEAGSRVVPLTDELVKLLRAHLKGLGAGAGGLVFPGADGRPLDYRNWLKRVWAPAVALSGLPEPAPTPHDCRHSYGSWLAEEGVPPTEIRDLMGHSSLRAVERYVHSSEVRMERARNALGARRAHGGESQSKKPHSPGGESGA